MDLQQFGSTIKKKYPAYKDYSDEEIGRRMLEKYPQYKDRVKTKPKEGVLSTGSSILRKLGLGIIPDAAATVANIPNLKNIGDAQRYKEGFKSNPFMDQEAIGELEKGSAKRLIENAAGSNPTRTMTNVMEVASGGGLLRSGTKAVLHPKATVGRAIEQKAEKAGRVSNELLEKVFGTFNNPNEKIIEGIGTARNRGKLLQKLKAEIFTQGRSGGGGIENPSYRDILNLRKGAGKAGKFGSNASEEDVLLNRKLQQAYSDVLKEGAGTDKLDKLFSLLSNIESKKKGIGAAAGGVLIYSLLNNLVNKLSSRN